MNFKPALAFLVVLAIALGLQWVSGEPFQRSPGEAFFVVASMIVAFVAATYPGFQE